MTFSVLCSAMPNDPRITALVEFDFDHDTISVCESSDNAWWTYNLKDVSTAMYKAERKEGLSLDARHEILPPRSRAKRSRLMRAKTRVLTCRCSPLWEP